MIGCRYGISRQNERYLAEIKDLYAGYVTGILPPGNEDLKGDEVEQIIAFKNALGLDDPDAAAMHIEVQFTFLWTCANLLSIFCVHTISDVLVCLLRSGNLSATYTHLNPCLLWSINYRRDSLEKLH